jgi:anaerobic selenocysteine-containing dehydrogenase
MKMAKKIIKSDCILCINSCGITATVEDGKLVKVEGLKEHGVSEGYICPRGEALVEYVYSPDRLQHPMKKVDGEWQRITWDEALDTIADKLTKLKEEHGARALAVYSGSLGTKTLNWPGLPRDSAACMVLRTCCRWKAIASAPGSWPVR